MSKLPKWGEPIVQLKLPDMDGYVDLGVAKSDAPLSSGVIPRNLEIDGDLSHGHAIEFLLRPDPETQKKIDEFQKILMDDLQERIREFNKRVEEFIIDALRTRVKPVIKGEITPGKIRYRRLRLLYGVDYGFIGILQRDRILYSVDGNTYDITNYQRIDEETIQANFIKRK